MRFSIITPTYKRAEKLARAVASVQAQTYTDWEMIIVNDSPDDTTYISYENSLRDPRIQYLKNKKNEGVNSSRNTGLAARSIRSTWTIFLDDDDMLAPDTLQTFTDLITRHHGISWFVTNRAYKDGSPITFFPKNDHTYTYARDYLILKRCKGDATHCIANNTLSNIRFSTHIQQAEEWLFFYQLGLRTTFFYHNHNSTISDGYDTTHGLNFRKRTRKQQLYTLQKLIEEGFALRLIYHPTYVLYLCARYLRAYIY